ncbi:MAG TPA: Holliday junction resolvase RuvX [Bacillota bacterium]|jgi:putative Holliday junction resolvase|nr:Holliday junction resolvase RuvX [Fastidiosipila sp.]HPX92719.1 Holliday junction resolvase RuvX [Bacillota bacterium]HQB80616.1 Holliday junction resolvase RuvX [Bacillota bacterium]
MPRRVLGVDFGTRRVGVAVSDPMRLFARRLVTLERVRGDGEGPVSEIAALCAEYNADTVVIGFPARTDGRDSETGALAAAFADALRQVAGCRVELYDERYTSVLASRIISETVRKKKKRDKSLVDRIAAEILLQDWLDREKGGLTAGPAGS